MAYNWFRLLSSGVTWPGSNDVDVGIGQARLLLREPRSFTSINDVLPAETIIDEITTEFAMDIPVLPYPPPSTALEVAPSGYWTSSPSNLQDGLTSGEAEERV
ncbi:hypothetical protein CHY08_22635 (plasmid) [Rhizobium leguminosarum bv. viciae]|nr:hypothetical protein CHY08_22635 [Rhizobium leguminosarum bv. viciae]